MYVSLGLLLTSCGATAALLLASPAAAADAVAPLLALSLVSLAALVWREHTRPTLKVAMVLCAALVLALLSVALPLHGSNDMWSYAMYGRILSHYHANPYTHPPSEYARDPALARVSSPWRGTESMYGPGFTLLSAGIVGVTRSSILATRVAFQLIAAASVLLCGAALTRARAPCWAACGLLLNPMVWVSAVSGGHNDVIVGAALLGATLAIARKHLVVGGLALAVAMSVKVVAVLSAAAAVAWVARHYGRRAAVRVAAVGAAPVAAGYLAFGGTRVIHPILRGSRWMSRASMWSLLRHVPYLDHHVGASAVLTVGVVTLILVRSRIDAASPADVIAAGALGYLLGAAYVLPWYLLWVLPVAALATRPRQSLLVLLYSGALMADYLARPARNLDGLDTLLRASVALTATALLVASVAIAVKSVPRLRRPLAA